MRRGPSPLAWAVVPLSLGAACLPATADAQGTRGAGRPPIYRMVWNAAPQGNVGETRTISPGEVAITLALTPPALFRTPQDVRDARGEVLAPAGMQFVALASQARIACTIHQMRRQGIEQALFLGSLKRLCLLDEDRDGRFERRFLRSTNGQAFFLLRGRLSDRQQPIEPVALVEEAPAALRDAPVIELRLDSSSRADRGARMSITVGRAGGGFAISHRLSSNGFPATFSAFGGSFEIAPAPDGGFQVRTLSQFFEQNLDFWD